MIYLNNEAQIHKIRESNLELLRILAMFCIVLHHLIVHGIRNVGYLPYSFEEICLDKQIPLIFLNALTVAGSAIENLTWTAYGKRYSDFLNEIRTLFKLE